MDPMTELDAINIMLAVIGEAPISEFSSVSANEVSDSAFAKRTLDETSATVQAEGWPWNTDEFVNINRNSDNRYTLPKSVLSCIFDRSRYEDRYVMRGRVIWDRREQTFEIPDGPDPMVANRIVTLLPWDEIPPQAQQYMAIRAARIYSNRYVNSNAVYVYTEVDEQQARAALMREEQGMGPINMLYGNDQGLPLGYGYHPGMGTRFRRN